METQPDVAPQPELRAAQAQAFACQRDRDLGNRELLAAGEQAGKRHHQAAHDAEDQPDDTAPARTIGHAVRIHDVTRRGHGEDDRRRKEPLAMCAVDKQVAPSGRIVDSPLTTHHSPLNCFSRQWRRAAERTLAR
jgi:hypothetical protein